MQLLKWLKVERGTSRLVKLGTIHTLHSERRGTSVGGRI